MNETGMSDAGQTSVVFVLMAGGTLLMTGG
jgi:hypothetical protein